ncbi:hypothetical protein LTR56_005146 [Elasticomyces elasticus]|nr:hypothetical protein LTR56_005146 [Elasticomyces elasticus]KAK3659602.1 hypothetical protein LTR22_008332 [Elasticomyces elasticus]KAK4921304.1 hypothetical protein LTR49_011307 [Elasticomyces elasticus]
MPDGLPTALSDLTTEERTWRRSLPLLSRHENLSRDQLADMQRMWRTSVEGYTQCSLTKQRDKLVAIAGIANMVQVALNEVYFAGLWQENLVEQLAWRVSADESLPTRQASLWQQYRAPSWAWPSGEGAIELPVRVLQHRDYILDIAYRSPQIELLDPAIPLGEIKSGSLRGRGQMYTMAFSNTDSPRTGWTWGVKTAKNQHTWCNLFPDRPLSALAMHKRRTYDQERGPDRSMVDIDPNSVILKVLMLAYAFRPKGQPPEGYTGHALALQHAGSRGMYGRVGLVVFRSLSAESWALLQQARLQSREAAWSEAFDEMSGFHTVVLV